MPPDPSVPPPSTLLLLPPSPYPPSYASLKAAFHAPLLTLLRALSTSHPPSPSDERHILDIAFPLPWQSKHPSAPRAALFDVTQKAVSNLYKLVAVISARERLNVEGDEGIDVRIVLVSRPRHGQVTDGGEDERGNEVDILVGLKNLARCRRWREVVSVESEEGEHILRSFLSLAEEASDGARFEVKRVKGGIVQVNAGDEASFLRNGYDGFKRHYSVINGGTFDHLHIGHKLLLSMTAFAVDRYEEDSPDTGARLVTIGITGAEQLKNKKYAEFLQPWSERQNAAHSFLRGIMCFEENEAIEEHHNPGPNGHVVEAKLAAGLTIRYTEIWDPFGPTITDPNVTALVLSEETRKGGQAVNEKRKEIGFPPLDIFEVDVLDAEEEDDHNQGAKEQADNVERQFFNKLSSTQLRKARHERERHV